MTPLVHVTGLSFAHFLSGISSFSAKGARSRELGASAHVVYLRPGTSSFVSSCLPWRNITHIRVSPRWLHSIGQKERARAILANLHSRDNDINSPLIQLEIEEIEEHIKIGGADSKYHTHMVSNDYNHPAEVWWDFRPLFRTKSDRARMWMVCLSHSA